MSKILSDEDGDGDEDHVNTTITQLFEILDNMESEIKSAMGNGQDNSVQSGVTFSDYK